ncbi:hypothetical protein C2804_01460 [Pasteurella multocida]|uniref:hypothetical protein n=1 Tax=Pasteurella multocida TaxID=747 RepID=UPI00147F069B|nr:hypothetical protein [Pasteurella multocida]NNH93663.1 hypothetical protein [Pasteurella multocida]NNH95859.1 hypothetical protein [Pasteurella multocida]
MTLTEKQDCAAEIADIINAFQASLDFMNNGDERSSSIMFNSALREAKNIKRKIAFLRNIAPEISEEKQLRERGEL